MFPNGIAEESCLLPVVCCTMSAVFTGLEYNKNGLNCNISDNKNKSLGKLATTLCSVCLRFCTSHDYFQIFFFFFFCTKPKIIYPSMISKGKNNM